MLLLSIGVGECGAQFGEFLMSGEELLLHRSDALGVRLDLQKTQQILQFPQHLEDFQFQYNSI